MMAMAAQLKTATELAEAEPPPSREAEKARRRKEKRKAKRAPMNRLGRALAGEHTHVVRTAA